MNSNQTLAPNVANQRGHVCCLQLCTGATRLSAEIFLTTFEVNVLFPDASKMFIYFLDMQQVITPQMPRNDLCLLIQIVSIS